jgi:hypothetical protein
MTARPLSPLLLALVIFAVAGCEEVYQDFFAYQPTGSSTSTGSAGACVPGEIAACYEGPAGTEGIGLCKPGSKTCATDGASFGACVGAILPVTENCATPVDEDCDGLAPSCKGKPLWSERAGDANDQLGAGVAVDGAGNVVVTGSFVGSVDLDGCPLSTMSSTGLFVAKLDPSGKCLWSKSAGETGGQAGEGVALDGSGNVLLTGYFNGAMDLGGFPLSNSNGGGLFVAKLDPSGKCLWSKSAGDTGSQTGRGIASDGAGDVLVTGAFSGSMDLGGCALAKASGDGLFIAKLDAAGKCLWSKDAGDAGAQSAAGVAVDGAGNVLVTGYYQGAMDLGGCSLANAGGTGLFIAKLDPSGKCLWSKSAGDTGSQSGAGVAVDGAGNVVVTGNYSGAFNLGGTCVSLSNTGKSGMVVVKLDPSGKCLWSKDVGNASEQYGYGVAVDSAGNVLVTGTFYGSIDFGDGSHASVGDSDFYLVKLDADGKHVWTHYGGGPYGDSGNGVAVDSADDVLVTGIFEGQADFGTGLLVSAGFTDVFIAKYGP